MAIALATTRQTMANYYGTLGTWFGSSTGAPGTVATPANEATGGSPAYARKQIAWVSGTGGNLSVSTPAIVDVAAGTYTHILMCSAVSGNNMVDNADVPDVVMNNQGQLVITPAFTIT